MSKTLKVQAKNAGTTWYIWLFPLVAVLITGYLLREYYERKGPSIRIHFDDASNVQAGKTLIRFRGVTIGNVKNIQISEDTKEVVLDVELQSNAEIFAKEGAKFWVVVPKVSFAGISGLETLFQGPYIAAQPGNLEASNKTVFKGQQGNDDNEVQESTTSYTLESASVESLNEGDVVTFRGLKVGSVDRIYLTRSAQTAMINIKIQNRYVRLIRENTVFWNKVGIQAKLGLFGSSVKINSFESIMHGGVELFTPDAPGPIAKARSTFRLLPAPPKGHEKWNPNLSPATYGQKNHGSQDQAAADNLHELNSLAQK